MGQRLIAHSSSVSPPKGITRTAPSEINTKYHSNSHAFDKAHGGNIEKKKKNMQNKLLNEHAEKKTFGEEKELCKGFNALALHY